MKRGFLDMEARLKAHRDELELMLKSELLDALMHVQNKIEVYVEQRPAEKAK